MPRGNPNRLQELERVVGRCLPEDYAEFLAGYRPEEEFWWGQGLLH